MNERYDTVTAKHYAAYRPPLHQLILGRAISSAESFKLGLDFGCGTGSSTVAIAEYCDHVHGIDSSPKMLNLADSHPKVTYQSGDVDTLAKFADRQYNIVTFAGSLFYVKSEALKSALLSVCKPNATVVAYDFNIQIDELIDRADLDTLSVTSNYDHTVGLSDWDEVEIVANETYSISISVTPKEASHLILSDSFRYDAIQLQLKNEDPFESLATRLKTKGDKIKLRADSWLTRYSFIQPPATIQQNDPTNLEN